METEEKKKKSGIFIALYVLAGVLLVAVIGIAAIYITLKTKYLDKSNYIAGEEYTIVETLEVETYVDENGNIQQITEAELDESEEEEVLKKHKEALDAIEEGALLEDTYNLLLIGVDTRGAALSGNSDVMILVTVNEKKETIYLTSFLRDLYANINPIGVRKLNASCAYGGPLLCVNTIRDNYKVDIDNFAMVNFWAMIDIVDALGGIDMEITEEEANDCNGYIREMCKIEGVSPEAHYFTGGGMTHMNGYRAVAFARNRKSGNRYDFGRTDRQRKVLEAILRKAKSGSLGTLSEAAERVLPYITHNIDSTTVINLITQLPKWVTYDIVQQHIPYDGEYYVQKEILIPYDMADTIRKLHSTLYE